MSADAERIRESAEVLRSAGFNDLAERLEAAADRAEEAVEA